LPNSQRGAARACDRQTPAPKTVSGGPIERGKNPTLDHIEGPAAAVAGARQVRADLIEYTARPWPHGHDPIRQHDGFLDVVGDQNPRRLAVRPQIEAVILQASINLSRVFLCRCSLALACRGANPGQNVKGRGRPKFLQTTHAKKRPWNGERGCQMDQRRKLNFLIFAIKGIQPIDQLDSWFFCSQRDAFLQRFGEIISNSCRQ
jgi:hypothetical protein